MFQNSSGGLFATKMDIKRPFEVRIVEFCSIFYGKYEHFPYKFTHFFVVMDVPSEKNTTQIYKNERGGGGKQPFINFIKKDLFFPPRRPLGKPH